MKLHFLTTTSSTFTDGDNIHKIYFAYKGGRGTIPRNEFKCCICSRKYPDYYISIPNDEKLTTHFSCCREECMNMALLKFI